MELLKQYMIDPIINNPVFSGGLSVVIISFIFYQLRSLPKRIYRLCLTLFTESVSIREYDALFNETLDLVTNSIYMPKDPKHIKISFNNNQIKTQIDISRFITKINNRFYLTSLGIDATRTSDNGATEKRWIITFVCFKGHRKYLLDILSNPSKISNNIKVSYPSIYHDGPRYLEPKRKRDSKTLCLPEGYYSSLLEDCRKFLNSKEEFVRKGIPWRLGIALYGNPGSGKSSIIHCLASDLCADVYYIEISKNDRSSEVIKSLNGVPEKSIVVLEDIDCMTQHKDRSEIELPFGSLLNSFDGLCANDNGRILIITTNHIDKLDPALIRPGRIDILREVPSVLNKNDAERYLKTNDYNVSIDKVYTEGMSPAEFIGNLRNFIYE